MGFNFNENAFMRGLARLCDLVLLNVLFIFCSIPIITIGASATAIYTVILKLVKHEESYIVKGFLIAFKENFKKATMAWLILLSIGLVVYFNWILSVEMTVLGPVILSICIISLTALTFVGMYIFPLIARYEDTLKGTFKNALFLAVTKLPFTLLLFVIHVGPLVFMALNIEMFMQVLIFYAIIGFATITWFNSKILRRVFKVFDAAIEAREKNVEDVPNEDR